LNARGSPRAKCFVPFAWSDLGAAPAADQFEVSVFGPGFGECAVVHLGRGAWVVVDSCADPADTRTPVPEAYLRAIGVDLGQVELIVATHWHDDHVKGLGRLVEICAAAKFSCANALLQDEFSEFIGEMSTGALSTEGAKVSEFRRVLRACRGRSIRYATGGRLLRAWPPGELMADECRVTALSPSDREYELFLAEIAKMRPKPGAPMRSAPRRTPNLASIVVNVSAGPVSVLLGADMEVHHDPQRGWSAAVEEGIRVMQKASLFKVAHHGSVNGDHEGAWSRLLVDLPHAVVTPFNRLRDEQKLPTVEDLKRIREKSSRLFLTATPRLMGRRGQRDAAVARSLKESQINLRERSTELGMVRMRRNGHAWGVELFGAASEVRN
jgi:Metallo-beta-lactamase superfamily